MTKTKTKSSMSVKASEDELLWGAKAPVVAPNANAPRRPHTGGGWEGVRSYRFGELAQMYYPDHNYDSALLNFRREMHETRGMWQAMQDVGYKENTKMLTRAQVRTIVRFLGEP